MINTQDMAVFDRNYHRPVIIRSRLVCRLKDMRNNGTIIIKNLRSERISYSASRLRDLVVGENSNV